MKRLIKPILFVVLINACLPAQSQYLAIKGGLNLSTQIIEDNTGSLSDDFNSKVGFNAGVLAGMGFGPIAVEGSLLLSSKGYAYEDTDISGGINRGYMNPLYLEVPIDLKLRLGTGNTKLYVSAGPSFGFGLTGKMYSEYELNGETNELFDEKIKWGNSEEDHLKTLDVGIGVGAGIDIGTLMLGFKYTFGMNNLSPVTSNGEVIKNRVMQFNLGFRIIDL